MLEKLGVLRLKVVRDNIRALTYAEMMELADEVRHHLIESGAVDAGDVAGNEVAEALNFAARDREYGIRAPDTITLNPGDAHFVQS